MEHAPLRRGRYKKYLQDINTPMPRTTKWRMMKRRAQRNVDSPYIRGSGLATTATLISGSYSEGIATFIRSSIRSLQGVVRLLQSVTICDRRDQNEINGSRGYFDYINCMINKWFKP